MIAEELEAATPEQLDPGKTTAPSKTQSGHAAFLLIVALIVYAQTFTFGFLEFDDARFIVQNRAGHQWASVPSYFTGSVHNEVEKVARMFASFYRPITGCWIILNYKLFGLHPALWRVSMLSMYLLGIWLTWRVAWKLTGDEFVAIAAALFFSLHPLHVEGVAWLSGACVETLVAVFFLASFLSYLQWREEPHAKWLVLSSFLMLLALLTKETAVALPVLIFAHALIFQRKKTQPGQPQLRLRPLILSALTGLIPYVLLRLLAIHGVVASHSHNLADVLKTAPAVFCAYLTHALWPSHLAVWYDLRFVDAVTVTSFYLPLLVCLGYAAITVWAIIRKPLIGFLLLWWVVCLAPAIAGLLLLENFEIIHDRFSFLALFGLCTLAACALRLLPARGPMLFGFRATFVVPLAGVTVLLGVLSARQVNFWRNDLAMNAHAVEVSPRVLTPRVSLGNLLMRSNDIDGSLALYRDTLALDPNHWQTLLGYGIALAYSGDRQGATAVLKHGIEVAPDKAPLYSVLAQLLTDNGHLQDAVHLLETAIPIVDYPEMLKPELSRLKARTVHTP